MHLDAQIILITAFALALIFEFINGFHDTANAVATVIYTRSLKPVTAVIWSGLWNFLGVLLSGGAVALSVLNLIPHDMLSSGDAGSIAALIAIPLAATLWNFVTWYAGLPASSSHTMIGAILGVGLMHSYLEGHLGAGINWDKATDVGLSLLISPVIGFFAAGLLIFAGKKFGANAILFATPDAENPPPPWVRGLLIFTCTGVSFAHGTNDGQKGIGLLMLVLMTMLPNDYAMGPGGTLAIPFWVKLLTAVVLGLGTMIGWKRIVVTIGEKIGKSHMNYAQGAAAELVAAATIQASSIFGLPVSTTHVLSSGVAGGMFFQGSGLQRGTVWKIAAAWILTLPASIFLSSALFGAVTFLLMKSLVNY